MNENALKNIRVVLTRPSHPGNIGAVARAMKTMGLNDLRLVTPRRYPDPEADARAAGAIDVLAIARVHDTLEQALEGCVLAVACTARHRELRHEVTDARGAAQALLDTVGVAGHTAALVFGNETAGLTAEEAGACPLWATVPTSAEFRSLNIAAAAQIFVYELRLAALARAGAQAAPAAPEFEPATLDEVAALRAHVMQVSARTAFYNPVSSKRLEPRLRRLLARARLDREEVNILRGFLNALFPPSS